MVYVQGRERDQRERAKAQEKMIGAAGPLVIRSALSLSLSRLLPDVRENAASHFTSQQRLYARTLEQDGRHIGLYLGVRARVCACACLYA